MIKDEKKWCSKCGEWKELSEFCKSKSTKDGLNYYCRSCVRTINANSRDKKHMFAKKIEYLLKDEMKKNGKKICAYCKEFKDFSEFGKYKSTKDGLSFRCLSCLRIVDEKRLNKKKPNRKRVRSKYKGVYGNGKNIIYGQNKEKILVDEEDYNKLIKYRWHINDLGYARTALKNRKMILIHRLIINAKQGECVDHVNGSTLDNRKCNLRICSFQENTRHKTKLSKRNKSGKTGVDYLKKNKKWRSQIRINNKLKYLGCFDNLEDAIEARIKAEEKYYGEFKPII